MAATRSQIKTQYERAKRLGWIPYFQEAAKTITKGYFDAADLMAIGSRETNLDPKWLTKKGDNGHGAGLMQIDDRSFPDFTNSDKWKDARLGILYGAKVLMQKWNDLQNNVGKGLKVKTYTFKGPNVSGIIAQQITIAAYNSGRWAAYHFTKHRHPDYGTTGKDYSQDVMARARIFRELLASEKTSAAPAKPSESVNPPLIPQPPATPPPEIPPQEPTVHVTQVGAEKEADKEVTGIQASTAGAVTFITTSLGGMASWLAGFSWQIVVGVALFGGLFVAARFWYANREKERMHKEKMEREKQAHEVQLALIAAAADKKQNTVELVPPATAMPNSDAPQEAQQ